LKTSHISREVTTAALKKLSSALGTTEITIKADVHNTQGGPEGVLRIEAQNVRFPTRPTVEGL
jgi:phosphoribosyl-dephospho-CoA transferase